ncbi:hypothetical protein Godav_010681, partial [Gossypium davidsonii]|nr:hypothetical protein [Gossypium davidsonii]
MLSVKNGGSSGTFGAQVQIEDPKRLEIEKQIEQDEQKDRNRKKRYN